MKAEKDIYVGPLLLQGNLRFKSVGNTSESSALQTQYINVIILFSAPKTNVMKILVSDQVLDPT